MTDPRICDAVRTRIGRYALCAMRIGVGPGIATILDAMILEESS